MNQLCDTVFKEEGFCLESTDSRHGNLGSPEIWIASHFHLALRWELFAETVKSLARQTLPPQCIRISWSTSIGVTPADVATLLNLHLAPRGIKWYQYAQPARLTQFEHLAIIAEGNLSDSKRWITFCDDDDMYHPQRLETLQHYIAQNLDTEVAIDHSRLVYVNTTYEQRNFEFIESRVDFGNICVKYEILQQFLKLYHDKEDFRCMPHMIDLIFRSWLLRFNELYIKERLYYRREAPFTKDYCGWSKC